MRLASRTLGAMFAALTVMLQARAQTVPDPGAVESMFAAGPAAPSSLVAARQHFFGEENVDPVSGNIRRDLVIFSWFSNSSFAVAIKGRVVFLDAFITDRKDGPARTPTTLAELAALKPEVIFVGHGHSDHAELAGYLAAVTGATLVGAPEHCDMARGDAVRALGPGAYVNCVEAVSRGSAPGAEVNALSVLKPYACVTAFRHLHSAIAAPDLASPPNPVDPLPDPRDAILFPPRPAPSDGVSSSGAPGGDLSIFYQFRLPEDFTFVWHNTVGPKNEVQRAGLFDIMRALPPTDIQFGSVVSLGFATNGVHDIGLYIDAVRPKIFVPNHFDNVSPEGSSEFWKRAVVREFDNHPAYHRPKFRWIHDHYDYVRPGLFTIDYKAPYWRKPSDPTRPSPRCDASL